MQVLLIAFAMSLSGFLTGLLISWGNIRFAAGFAAFCAVVTVFVVLSDRYPALARFGHALDAVLRSGSCAPACSACRFGCRRSSWSSGAPRSAV